MRLRRLEEKDCPLMLEWMHDTNVVRNLKNNFSDKKLEDCIIFVKNSMTDSDKHFAIVDINDEYMGTVSLKNINSNINSLNIPNINDKEPLENLKLIGYTIDSEELISKIDSSYEDSTVIKGMKKGKNGFYAYTKLLNNKKINEMLELVDQKIDEAINNITNADFEINPKKSDKFSSCDKCIYNEICYRNEKDFVYLKEGEKNA